MLDNTPNQFRTKNRVEINDDARGTCNTNSEIKFKTSMLKSSLCDYSDAYILLSGTIIVTALATGAGIMGKKLHLKIVLYLLIVSAK